MEKRKKMELITTGGFSRAIGTHKYPMGKINDYLIKLLKINQINQLYSTLYTESGIEFIENLINELNIKIHIEESELNRIPKDGKFISISNHPFGAIDGILLIYILAKRRPDFKIMANFLLENVEPIKDYIVPVNPFETRKSIKSSYHGLKEGMKHLDQGHPIGIFPAGEVSTFQSINTIADKSWNPGIIRYIKKAQAPVLPVYFHGSNSLTFHLLGLINPNLRTAALPSELLNKKNKQIHIRIGKPISVEEQDNFIDANQFGKFLRAKTYALSSSLDVKKFYFLDKTKLKNEQNIVAPIAKELIAQEIKKLPEENFLFSYGDYDLYYANSLRIPNTINEIGRLRETTFRAIGEGTGKSVDLDEYDFYYNQLFIWDKKNQKVVGGYRIGLGKDIMHHYGKKGFYVNSLFRFNNSFSEYFEQSIELGRSFVTQEYQRKAFPLFCLWKGILHVLIKNPDYRYLIGPVSISNQYSQLSKNLIIEFIQSKYFDYNLANQVKPRKKYKLKYKSNDYKLFLEYANDINSLDKIIEDIEIGRFKIPVLFKKYIGQNARIIGFNRDPKFKNALDGLMILDVNNIPLKTLKSLSDNGKDYANITTRFYGKYVSNFSSIPQY